jgi:serine/threonine-protein kinase HipA
LKKCLACYEKLTGSEQEYHEKCCRKIFGSSTAPILDYNLREITLMARQVIANRFAIPGVQPKLSMTTAKIKTKNHKSERFTIVGLWNGLYVLKPPTKTYPGLPENEDLTMHMAAACGIETATHTLVRFKSGELAYLARRFDRRLDKRKKVLEKLHQEDMCQLTGLLTENKYNSSMEKVVTSVRRHTTNKGLEAFNLFKLTLFSFLTGNSDMHLKNFSLLKQQDGRVSLSPAYDLLATRLALPSDTEDSALTIGGKKTKLSKADFLRFAKYSQIPEKAAENALKDFEVALPKMFAWIDRSFLSKAMKADYVLLIRSRGKKLGLKI